MLYALPPNSNCVFCELFRQNSMNKETIVGNNSSESLDSIPSTQNVLSLRLFSPSDSPLEPSQGSVTHQDSPFHPIINIPGFTCLQEPRVLMTPASRYWWMCISKQDRWVLAKLHTRTASFNSRSSGHSWQPQPQAQVSSTSQITPTHYTACEELHRPAHAAFPQVWPGSRPPSKIFALNFAWFIYSGGIFSLNNSWA